MNFLFTVLRILLMPAVVLLIAAPFLFEYLGFRRDRKRAISHKRFRVAVFAIVYAVGMTVALYFLKELITWLASLPVIRQVASWVSVSGRLDYCARLLVAVLVNVAIGFLFRFLLKFVRIGLKKKNLSTPKKKDGSFSLAQKLERKVLAFFHTETWFFVGRILKWFNILLSAAYAIIFIAYQMPALFGADWIPYALISMIFSAGYIYPTVTLLVLWEAYFFLEGIRRMEDECPELLQEDDSELHKTPADIALIDEECRSKFGGYYVGAVEEVPRREEIASTDHDAVTRYIGRAVENDRRNPKPVREIYLDSMDRIVAGDRSVLINGDFFSEFSMYFFRYLSMVVARGDNVVLVCNSDSQIDEVYDYLWKGLAEQTSLYGKDFSRGAVDFDDPIWRIVKVSGERDSLEEAGVDNNNILITTLNYLCSTEFEQEHRNFVHLLDTVVFVDTLATINDYTRQMSILNTRLRNITKTNSLLAKNIRRNRNFDIRYMSHPIRYVCFDSTRTPGLDKVLKNMLSERFDTVDAMSYNPETVMRCYNFEPRPGEDGEVTTTEFIKSEERLDVVMNMALLCLAKGAPSVTVFVDGAIPYANFAESLEANRGQISMAAGEGRLRINKHFFNPDDYSVLLVVDTRNDLPAALRRYASMLTDKPALVVVFSRPYMLRDYYAANIDALWQSSQLAAVPVTEGTKNDSAQKILIKASAGGITTREILDLCAGVPQLGDLAAAGNVNAILRVILDMYGIEQSHYADLFDYFEYSSSKDFDENGEFSSEERVTLRRRGKVFDMISGRDMVEMVVGGEERVVLPVPRDRLTQNFITRQNLIHDGNIYHIREIDTAAGRLHVSLTVGGKNTEAYRYIQARHYRVDCAHSDVREDEPAKHVHIDSEKDGLRIDDAFISAFRAPAEVVTSGYYAIDPYSMDPFSKNSYRSIDDPGNDLYAKQTYRKYGAFAEPTYLFERVNTDNDRAARGKGIHVLSLRFTGQFGENSDRTAALAAVMLGEIIHSMFPSVADAVVVCPVLHGEMSDEDAKVLHIQPKLSVIGKESAADELELWLIEDSDVDLGVISVLMSSGSDVCKTLFEPVLSYLNWYLADDDSEKSKYLHFGLDHEPECFDFDSLQKLAWLLGNSSVKHKYVDLEGLIEYETCDFCGKRYTKGDSGVAELDDGRRMCKACAENLVGNNKKELRAHLDRARIFLESTYGITLDDDYEFCFDSTVKIANTLKHNRSLLGRGSDIPLKSYIDSGKVHIEYSIPSASLSELLVRELTHVWQLGNLPDIDEALAEGHIALVAIRYLRFLNQSALAGVRAKYYESTDAASGEGYRRLARELTAKPQFAGNPFRYLLSASGRISEQETAPVPRIPEGGDYGLSYTPESPDRHPAGQMPYFYYSRLPASEQAAYDTILAAIESHAEQTAACGCTFEALQRIVQAIRYDHPELFHFKNFALRGEEVLLRYGASAEETEMLRRRIDEVVPKYLAGITDTMSGYDAAIRIHTKIINAVDYDTIALDRQKAEGGPPDDRIDYLRTICGVFLNGKAVCEGYARAMQYLLQKCGIECAECAGYTKQDSRESGSAHAWNILKLDGDYYYLDATWDDNSNTIQTAKVTDFGFGYFCITTDELLRTRAVDLCPTDMPVCSATRCNYYRHNGLVIDSYDTAKVREFAAAAAEKGEKSFTFKCGSKAVYDVALGGMCIDGKDCFEILNHAAKADKKISTSSYSYSYNEGIRTITINFKRSK